MDDIKPTSERLLRAAVELIGESGISAVTHRSVEERAGVARGSTRYHFKTREALLEAVLGYVAEQDMAVIDAAIDSVGGPEGLAALDPQGQNLAAQAITKMMLADPAASLVRFELYLYAARRPELTEAMARWRDRFISIGTPGLAVAGAAHPEAAAMMLVASVEGLLLHRLSTPHPELERWGPAWVGLMGEAAVSLGADETS